jgi:transcriptional regulator with XRE-family HTH domain
MKRKPVRGIGGAIQRLRQSKRIGLVELAGRAGLGKGLISKIETTPDRDIKLSTLQAIAKGFGMDVLTFLEEVTQ